MTEARIGKVVLVLPFSEQEIETDEVYFVIWLEVENITTKKKIDWTAYEPELTDDNGNKYRHRSVSYIKGNYSNPSLYPGKSLRTVYLFEVPVDGFNWHHFKLTAESFGEDGDVRIQIPKQMVATANRSE